MKIKKEHRTLALPVSQIASFNFFPPRVTYFTLKSTPAKVHQKKNDHDMDYGANDLMISPP